ncbi:MAG: AsmA-like C-terminal region-containing protein [Isosphaeraceae bacterium]
MAIRRWRWYLGLLVGLILTPPLLWILVVLIAPTGWAKGKVVAILESRSGRRVSLEGLSVRFLGGIRLTNLEIGSPKDLGNPWLKASDVRLDIGPLQIVRGNLRPTRVDVDGVDLRVLRRADGSVELADLIQPISVPSNRLVSWRARPADHVDVQVRHTSMTVLDEPTRTHLHLRDVEGEGFSEGPRAVVKHLRGTLNGGTFQFAAQIDRTASALSLESQFLADDVNLDDEMNVLSYVVPVLAGAPAAVQGRLTTDFRIQGQGTTWASLCRFLSGRGAIALDPITLDGAPLVAELSKFADLPKSRRTGSIRTDFVYKDRRITTDHFTMTIARLPITMSGWTDLDGRLDYHMKIQGLNDRLPDQARRILGDLKVDVGSLTSLTLRGSLQQMVVQLNGVPIDRRVIRDIRDIKLNREEKDQLKLLGRQLRDKYLR